MSVTRRGGIDIPINLTVHDVLRQNRDMARPSDSTDVDPRALRSRRLLHDALRDLLTRTTLADIGVAELCRAAGVHRTTFYGHYDSVGDLAADVYASIIDEASSVVPAHDAPLPEISNDYLRATVAVLDAVAGERDAIRALLDSSVSLSFRQRMRTHFLKRATDAIDVIRARGVDLPRDAAVGAAVIAGGTVSAIELWAQIDSDDAETFAERIRANMPAWWP